jgi:hypothetical protein
MLREAAAARKIEPSTDPFPLLSVANGLAFQSGNGLVAAGTPLAFFAASIECSASAIA